MDRGQIQRREGACLPPPQPMENPMAWNTPKIVEVPLGAEINSYVCGEKK
ncbi:Coenzyme PQQ synthesis protein A [Gluconacetobacter sp. SXCC-1]|nr:Coenzyme PQQ synthesis protein A [Gluconacetobacter sp. SXCC-1]